MKKLIGIGVYFLMICLTIGGCRSKETTSDSGYLEGTEVVVLTTQKNEEAATTAAAVPAQNMETETTTEQEQTTQHIEIDYSLADAISPTEYEGYELEWEVIDLDGTGMFITDILKTVIKDRRILAEYEYDGYKRISKHMDGVTTYFTYNAKGELSVSDDGTHRLEYIYVTKMDGDNSYTYKDGFTYNGEKYYFLYGGAGLIEGIEKDGEPIARYLYDGLKCVGTCKLNEAGEWELCTDEEFVGNLNKIRYDGLYYDDETGWYSNGWQNFDPVNIRNVGGISPEEAEEAALDYALGLPIDSRYEVYGEYSIPSLSNAVTGLSYCEVYSDISEPLVAARRGSTEWQLLNDNYKVNEQYVEYIKEYTDRRFLSPSIIADSSDTKKCVYTGTTQTGRGIMVSHSTGNELEISYNGKKVVLDVWEFKNEDGSLRPVQVFFKDMNKDSVEELVLVWDTILMIDLDTLQEIKFFVKQRGYYCYKITDEEAKAMDDLLAKVVPDHKYTSSGSGCYGGWDYFFKVEGDRIYYYRDDKVDGELLTYEGRIVYEYDGTQFAKSYELASELDPFEEDKFEYHFTKLVKTVYYNLLNGMQGGKYEAYFGTVEENKGWNLKVYYDNIDYDNYAVEIYDGENLVSRSFWKADPSTYNTLKEAEVSSFLEGEYTLLYEIDITL